MRTTRLIGLALAGLLTTSVALWIDVRSTLLVYVATAATISAISVGGLGVLMITYLVRGQWTTSLHLPLTAAALAAPVSGLLFVPVLLGIPWIYPWAQHAGEDHGFKAIWLLPWFFGLRTLLYFAVWTALAMWVRRSWADPRRMVVSASVGLIAYAVTGSFAGIDWIEALTPEFHSSLYGLLFLTFELLGGLGFALAVVLADRKAKTHRYGAILLSTLLLWAYNHAMQYIIVWSGNIPEEATWYVEREAGAWGWVLWSLVALQFIGPFFALLSSRIRESREWLLGIATLTLALRFVEAYLLALPGHDLVPAALLLAMVGTIVFLGAAWWSRVTVLLSSLASSQRDIQALPEAFDPSGSPASPARPS